MDFLQINPQNKDISDDDILDYENLDYKQFDRFAFSCIFQSKEDANNLRRILKYMGVPEHLVIHMPKDKYPSTYEFSVFLPKKEKKRTLTFIKNHIGDTLKETSLGEMELSMD